MGMELTLCIVKPDVLEAKRAGELLAQLEAQFELVELQLCRLSKAQAEAFYGAHRERPFFGPLVAFMSGGPALLVALRGEDAIQKLRERMGSTDSRQAAPGTLRREFGTDNRKNAVHGSDSPESARRELGFFFGDRLRRL